MFIGDISGICSRVGKEAVDLKNSCKNGVKFVYYHAEQENSAKHIKI
jgi:hypothetical protein